MRKHTLNPNDINPYVISIVHRYWDLLAEQYLLDLKIDNRERNWHGAPSYKYTTLSYVCCTYYAQTYNLKISVIGHSFHDNLGFAFFNGSLKRHEDTGIWPMSDMLYDLNRVYSLVHDEKPYVCSTSVTAPTAHELADSVLAVDMIHRWRLG